MSYDLNVPWHNAHGALQKTLAFLSERMPSESLAELYGYTNLICIVGYKVVALDNTLSGKISAAIVSRLFIVVHCMFN